MADRRRAYHVFFIKCRFYYKIMGNPIW